MLIVLSPAKSLDYDTAASTEAHTLPDFIPDAAELVTRLKSFSPAEIASLMRVSDPLAALNAGRYANWSRKFTSKNAKQAVLAFNGDVYEGLGAPSLQPRQLEYLQSHLRILSGLYGVLRPLDLMQPYRLEMGTRLENGRGKDLYAFWGARVTKTLSSALTALGSKALVNLASEEYFKVVKPGLLPVPVITPIFEDWKGGKYKVISFHAKRARGLMTRYASLNGIQDVDELKSFDLDGYAFDAGASSATKWLFRRKLEA